MTAENRTLKLCFMNIHGQTKLPKTKQMQIEDFVKYNKIDILNIQEIEVRDDTFSECSLLSSSYNIIQNNSQNILVQQV